MSGAELVSERVDRSLEVPARRSAHDPESSEGDGVQSVSTTVSTKRTTGPSPPRSVTVSEPSTSTITIRDGRPAGGPYPERVFGLTDEGHEFTEEYLTEHRERPDSYEMRVQRLEDEVDDLKTTNERLEDEVETLREEKADREKIREELQGTYWESIVDLVDERTADQ